MVLSDSKCQEPVWLQPSADSPHVKQHCIYLRRICTPLNWMLHLIVHGWYRIDDSWWWNMPLLTVATQSLCFTSVALWCQRSMFYKRHASFVQSMWHQLWHHFLNMWLGKIRVLKMIYFICEINSVIYVDCTVLRYLSRFSSLSLCAVDCWNESLPHSWLNLLHIGGAFWVSEVGKIALCDVMVLPFGSDDLCCRLTAEELTQPGHYWTPVHSTGREMSGRYWLYQFHH